MGRISKSDGEILINNIGIIGLGSIGQRHLRLVRELRPALNITLVRSGNGESIEDEKLADTVCYTLSEALNTGIQAAIISTPSVYHVEQAIVLIRAGVHVLVEKPLSHSTVNINKLLKIRRKSKIIGLVGYCLRYDPAALKFKAMLNEEMIGEIIDVTVECGSYLPDWHPNKNYRESVSANKKLGGGALLELSHELDYVNWFFGDIDNVSGKLINSDTLDIDVEDSVDMIFNAAKGFTISIHLDFNSQTIRRTCKVRSTNGNLVWDAVAKKVVWQSVDEPEEDYFFHFDQDEIYREQLKHFIDCIENNQSPRVTFEDGAKVLRIVEAARKSSATGKRVAMA